MTINRVYCGLNADGQVCVDSTNSSTVGGGFWPKGTPDQYVFNSGLQLAGVIGTDGGPWASDTTGGFFFDPKGQLPNTVKRSSRSTTPPASADLAAWPARPACRRRPRTPAASFGVRSAAPDRLDDRATVRPDGVPYCRRSASQGDIWFMSWEGNPSLTAGPDAPAGDRGRDPRHGVELPDRQRRHSLLHLHLLQRHLDQRGRLRRHPASRSGHPARTGRPSSRSRTRPAASTLPTGGYTIDQPVRGLRRGHGRLRGCRRTTPR